MLDLIAEQRVRDASMAEQARTSARELLAENAGPWAVGDFLAEIRERGNVTSGIATYVVNEMISGYEITRKHGGAITAISPSP